MVAFSAQRYNSCPSIEDAHRVIKTQQQWAGFCDEFGECLCRHGLRHTVHVRVVHKHFPVGDGQVMCERYEADFEGQGPALVACPAKATPLMFPESWMVDAGADAAGVGVDSWMPFEFSTDPLVRKLTEEVSLLTAFWKEAREVILRFGLANVVAVGILPRSHGMWNPADGNVVGFPLEKSFHHPTAGPISVVRPEFIKAPGMLYSSLNWAGIELAMCQPYGVYCQSTRAVCDSGHMQTGQ